MQPCERLALLVNISRHVRDLLIEETELLGALRGGEVRAASAQAAATQAQLDSVLDRLRRDPETVGNSSLLSRELLESDLQALAVERAAGRQRTAQAATAMGPGGGVCLGFSPLEASNQPNSVLSIDLQPKAGPKG